MRRPSAGAAQSYLAVGGTDRDSDIGSQHDCECRSQFNSESTVEGGGGGRGTAKRRQSVQDRGAVTSGTAQWFNEVRNLTTTHIKKRPFRSHMSTHLLSFCTT